MKKTMRILTVMLCWMIFVLPVRADLIWAPFNDEFFDENRKDCRYVERNYTANGPEGKVIVYKSPENPTVVSTWENGHVETIYYTWTDEKGIVWGMNNNRDTNETGWVPMEYMDVVYDNISFWEENYASFVKEKVTISSEYIGEYVIFWSYPGAGPCSKMLLSENDVNSLEFMITFVDEAGRKWGYISYYYGIKNMWVCLDNPVSDINDLDHQIVTERDNLASEENAYSSRERITPLVDSGTIGLIICMVLGVCGATGGALLGMKKRKDKK